MWLRPLSTPITPLQVASASVSASSAKAGHTCAGVDRAQRVFQPRHGAGTQALGHCQRIGIVEAQNHTGRQSVFGQQLIQFSQWRHLWQTEQFQCNRTGVIGIKINGAAFQC